VYSTCSLEPEENEDVVAEVLRETTGFEVIAVEGILDQLAASGVVTGRGPRAAANGDGGGFPADAAGGASLRWVFRRCVE